jgi:hypothetical protein
LKKAALRAVLEHGRQKRQWQEGPAVPAPGEDYMVTDFILVEAAGYDGTRQRVGSVEERRVGQSRVTR